MDNEMQDQAEPLSVRIVTFASGNQAIAPYMPGLDIEVQPDDDPIETTQRVVTTVGDAKIMTEKISTHRVSFDTMKKNITIKPKAAKDMPDMKPSKDAKEVITLRGRMAR